MFGFDYDLVEGYIILANFFSLGWLYLADETLVEACLIRLPFLLQPADFINEVGLLAIDLDLRRWSGWSDFNPFLEMFSFFDVVD